MNRTSVLTVSIMSLSLFASCEEETNKQSPLKEKIEYVGHIQLPPYKVITNKKDTIEGGEDLSGSTIEIQLSSPDMDNYVSQIQLFNPQKNDTTMGGDWGAVSDGYSIGDHLNGLIILITVDTAKRTLTYREMDMGQ